MSTELRVCVSNLDVVRTGLTRATKQLPSQQVSVVLQEGQVEVPEELHVFVLYSELLWRVPVNHLETQQIPAASLLLCFFVIATERTTDQIKSVFI